MNRQKKIAVVGAGISGLSSAYWLDKSGWDVSLFDKNTQCGGTIVTEKEDGFLIDYGPNSTLETSETLSELIRELGIEDQKVYGSEESNNRYIIRDGQLHALPMTPQSFLKTKLFSGRAKLRLFKEPFIKPSSGNDIALAELVKYRLGQEFLDYAINPFVAGVYAGDPETLSTAAAFPKLLALEREYGSFIKGAIKGKRKQKQSKEVAKNRAKLFSFVNGMQTFTDALSDRLTGKIFTGHELLTIRKEDGQFVLDFNVNGNTQQFRFDRLIISVPAYVQSKILTFLAPEEAARFSEIKYPPVAVVFSAFRQSAIQRPLDGFGFLIPRVENRKILGSIWSSVIFPNRAPQGYAAFTTFIGGTRQPELALADDTDLEKIVFDDLNDLIGLTEQPVLTKTRKWPKAIPQYTVGYSRYQKLYDALEEKHAGLYFAGNFRRGISVGDSVLSARETVDKILKHS